MSSYFNPLLIIACLSLVSFSQTLRKGEPQPSPEFQAKSIVRGRALYEGNERPVRRGMIGLVSITDFEKQSAANRYSTIEDIRPPNFVITDDSGEFAIGNVKPGTYYAFVNVPNVINPQSINRYYGRNSRTSFAKLGEIFQKIVVDGISETIVTVRVRSGGAISGRAQYPDGSPAVGMTVKVIRKATVSSDYPFVTVQDLKTDDRGYYRFTELPPGSYIIDVVEHAVHRGEISEYDDWRGSDGSELITYFPSTSILDQAESVDVDWNVERSNLDIIIPDRRLFKISGVVIGKDTQKPVEKIIVAFQRIVSAKDDGFFDGSDRNQVTTGPNGTWSFKELPKGRYRLQVSQCANYYCDLVEGENAPTYGTAVKEIELDADDLTDLKLEIPPAASVSGTVVVDGDKEIPDDVSVSLFDFKSKLEASTRKHRNQDDVPPKGKKNVWNFRIGMLSEGSYRALAGNDDYYLKSLTVGSTDYSNADLKVVEGQDIKDVRIVLGIDAGTFNGKIFQAKDIPAQFTAVLLVPVEISKQGGLSFYCSGETNSQGDVLITAAPGEYFVTFPTREHNRFTENDWLDKATKNAERVTIKSEKTIDVKIVKPTQ
jgi:hypothetical protein